MITIKRTNIFVVLFIFISMLLSVPVASATGNKHKHKVLQLVGTGHMYFKDDVPGVEVGAMCFDVELVNAKNNKIIGTGTDCFHTNQPGF